MVKLDTEILENNGESCSLFCNHVNGDQKKEFNFYEFFQDIGLILKKNRLFKWFLFISVIIFVYKFFKRRFRNLLVAEGKLIVKEIVESDELKHSTVKYVSNITNDTQLQDNIIDYLTNASNSEKIQKCVGDITHNIINSPSVKGELKDFLNNLLNDEEFIITVKVLVKGLLDNEIIEDMLHLQLQKYLQSFVKDKKTINLLSAQLKETIIEMSQDEEIRQALSSTLSESSSMMIKSFFSKKFY
jgi:hypothetical protein